MFEEIEKFTREILNFQEGQFEVSKSNLSAYYESFEYLT
jgi:hypothetical protein